MIRDIEERFFAKVLRGSFGDLEALRGASETLHNLRAHGTTTGAMLIEDGEAAIVFSDGKVTKGNLSGVVTLDFCKMFRIDQRSCVLIAGALGPASVMVKKLEAMVGFMQDAYSEPLPADVIAEYAQLIQRENLVLAAQGLEVSLILVASDRGPSNQVKIYKIIPDGSCIQSETAEVMGSGESGADPRITDAWEKNLSQDNAVSIVRNIAKKTPTSDNFSGGTWVVWRVDFDGVQEIERWS